MPAVTKYESRVSYRYELERTDARDGGSVKDNLSGRVHSQQDQEYDLLDRENESALNDDADDCEQVRSTSARAVYTSRDRFAMLHVDSVRDETSR